MAFKTIIVDIDDHVARVTLNRPDAMNAINKEMIGELAIALSELDANERVRVIIITGSEKAFAAGMDVSDMAELELVDVFTGELFAVETQAIENTRPEVLGSKSLDADKVEVKFLSAAAIAG